MALIIFSVIDRLVIAVIDLLVHTTHSWDETVEKYAKPLGVSFDISVFLTKSDKIAC